jgi:hypothetical protein
MVWVVDAIMAENFGFHLPVFFAVAILADVSFVLKRGLRTIDAGERPSAFSAGSVLQFI